MPQAKAVAGGTALQADWASGAARPATLVDLASLLPRGVGDRGATIEIGAGTTLADLEREPLVARRLPLLAAAVRAVAAAPVRRLGTVGGNVGWRQGCLLPTLLVLEAQVRTHRGAAPPQWCALSAWLDDPGGIILGLRLDAQAPDERWTMRKTGLRAAFTPAVVVCAGRIGASGPRLAVGGGPVRPQRLAAGEAALACGADAAALRAAVAGEMEAPDCVLRSGRYRRRVAAAALASGLLGAPRPALPRVAPSPAPQPVGCGGIRLSRADQPGRWHPRPDLPAKIAGVAGYLTDRRAPGMLVARILRAAHPHARILRIDVGRARALAGVHAVVTAADVPGENAFGIMTRDRPALCADKVRFLGDAVAAVAADDAATAQAALALVEVDYAPLPTVDDPQAALADGAVSVHAAGNLASCLGLERGDVAAGFAAAAHLVEATYVTPRQMHAFLETEGGWAAPENGGLVVAVGGQHGARDREQLARILALRPDRIRVVTSPTGGAFGGKDELTVQPALALLALKTQRPVRLHLDRAESVCAGIKRSPMRIRMRTACDGAGRLLAHEVDVLADCGAYTSLTPAVLETALEHAAGPYVVANVRTRGRLAYTNNGVCGAFRGFGANEMTFAVECQMDRLARRVGLHPVEIRRRNLRAPGAPGFLGQRVAPTERLAQMLDAAAASPLWHARTPAGDSGAAAGGNGASPEDSEEVEGVAMALNYQGNGLGSVPRDEGAARLALAADGAIEVHCGLDEMGQGLVAGLVAAVAARLGCGREDVRVVYGDTGATPDSGSTSASRGGYVIWKGVELTAPAFADDLLAFAARRLACPPTALRLVPGGVAEAGSNTGAPTLSFAAIAAAGARPMRTCRFAFPKTDHAAGNARFIFASGATLARVAVSRVTGAVRVLDLHLHTAAGPVIDVASYLGQIEGGGVQGLGFALFEDAAMAQGRLRAHNFDGYVVPGVRDSPADLQVFALEDLDADDPYGPRGVGEIGIGAVAPAIASAVAAAIGAWPTVLPLDPERILELIDAAPAPPAPALAQEVNR